MEHANRKGGMTDSTWNAYDGRITTPLLRCAPWQRPADAATAFTTTPETGSRRRFPALVSAPTIPDPCPE